MDYYYLGGITLAGISSGLLAGLVGGGAEIIIVPLLTIFGLLGSLKHRIGTTLFMLLPPIGLFAALRYYNKGYVDIKAGLYFLIHHQNIVLKWIQKHSKKYLVFLQYYLDFIFIIINLKIVLYYSMFFHL